jgi:hypothetical protein
MAALRAAVTQRTSPPPPRGPTATALLREVVGEYVHGNGDGAQPMGVSGLTQPPPPLLPHALP